MTDPVNAALVTRCAFEIEKDWKGHRAVLSRRRCKNRVRSPFRYCHVHRYMEADRG